LPKSPEYKEAFFQPIKYIVQQSLVDYNRDYEQTNTNNNNNSIKQVPPPTLTRIVFIEFSKASKFNSAKEICTDQKVNYKFEDYKQYILGCICSFN
jgi:hypothetical protein